MIRAQVDDNIRNFLDEHEIWPGIEIPENGESFVWFCFGDWMISKSVDSARCMIFKYRRSDEEFTDFLKEFYPEVFL